MGKVIIHIGMHKTASTFLQRQLFKHLRRVGIYTEPRFYDRLGTFEIEDNFLISSEGLSGVAWNSKWLNGIRNSHHWIDSFRSAVRNLKLIYPDATIVIVMRRHGDLLLSMYKQYVQEGGVLAFSEFYGDQGVIRDQDLDYQSRLTFLREHFQNTLVLSFDAFRQQGADYFIRAFGSLGLPYEVEAGTGQFRIQNQSISGKKVDILRNINKGYRHVPEKVRRIIQRLGFSPRQILQKKMAFWKPEDTSEIKRAIKAVNEKFSADWEYTKSQFTDV